MTLHALASGTLFRSPESKISKAGKAFYVATLKVKDGDGATFVKLLVFSESAGAELMRLQDGDAVSAQGSLKAETWERNGETKISLTIIADQVLALRAEKKARSKATSAPPPDNPPPPRPAREPGDLNRYSSVADCDLDDALPF
jgi:single-stranded DNA-binding protein